MSRPVWSKFEAPAMPDGPCAIELYAYSLGIERSEWAKSRELRNWGRKYVRTRYVPSDLIEVWGLYSD